MEAEDLEKFLEKKKGCHQSNRKSHTWSACSANEASPYFPVRMTML